MNIIDEIGILAISTRLQRLSEQLRKDGALIYKSFDIDFEPKWFPVIYTLHIKEMLSVVEIASEIGYSHPSTISLLKELEKQKLISSKKDKLDERKRLIVLTAKGKELVVKMQPVWTVMKNALNEITDNQNNLLRAIEETEQKLATQGFFKRISEFKS
ncbi:transcriptional regulator SlyA [Flavobacterium sp. ACN2]|uniref:MarR family winged helix-turn-helix transcriptional regulator n=1 Tax=unclassified Flavobacterium TaxID=196869 RepID=UPI000BB30169|nr:MULTISPECIES: MarR family transcriptional regulator [unclassified Flavobacterium]MDY0989719.1 MarR family transcriptional regulator [Flavobacterium sp. CFBP9031]PBI94311.1 transcriptional regulator SlyA [Flavobacterium sp. ACN2]